MRDDDRRQLRCEDDGAQRVADGTGSSTALDGSVVVDLRTLDTGTG